MNILVTTGIFPPDVGGPASYVPKICNELLQKKHNVHVVTLSEKQQQQENYSFSVTRILRKQFIPIRIIKTILKIIKLSQNKDCIYCNGLAFETRIASLFTFKPIVYKIVGDFAWERAVNKGWFNGTIDEFQISKKNLRLKLLEWHRNFSLNGAKKIIVPSKYLKKIVTGWGIEEKRIEIIYNAFTERNNPYRREKKEVKYKTITTVCRLVPWKGVEGIINAVSKIKDVQLVIIGDGPSHKYLEQCVTDAKIENRVTFTGNIKKESVWEYLQQTDVFVLNSTYEGLPHVVLEAMSAKIPVIATDVGGTGEVVKNNVTGILIPPGNETHLILAIKTILTNKEFSDKLVKNATKSLFERFSYTYMIDGTINTLTKASKIKR